jgi:acyl-CoA synthetase (NDP forming)
VRRDLTSLFEPRSVAIVGASADPEKWGYWFARDAAKARHRRRVFLVSRSGGELHGLPVHRTLAELPEAPELVVLSVPAAALEDAVDASLAAGAKALVAIAAGLGELGPEGAERERAITDRVRAAGALLVGPNCLGVFDAAAELDLASNPLPGGRVGFVSQSGNVALETGLLLDELGLGFSRMVSIGNQADVDVAEVVASLAGHEPTRVIAVYCEDFRDGRAFAETARTAGKPVVLLTVGRTIVGARAARSHTGALTSDLDVVDAVCRAAGIHRVDTPRELVDTVQALLSRNRPRGRRVAVVGDGGGYGAIASDLLGARGLVLEPLGADAQARLRSLLPPTATTTNPVDLAGAGEQDMTSFARSARVLLEAEGVDAVLFTAYFGGYSSQSDEFGEREVAVAGELVTAVEETGRPLVVHTMYWDSPPARALRAAGIPVYRAIESAVRGLAALATDASAVREQLPDLPEPATPLSETGYAAAREALAAEGITFAAARTEVDREGVLATAAEIGYPVVLKALGSLHKSDAGAIVLGVPSPDVLAAAFEGLARRLSVPAYSVEAAEDTAAGFELLVGARRDPRFGPVVVVGAGGIHAEVLRDTAVAAAPVDAVAAETLLRSLACAPLLEGARGRPALDLAAAAEAVAALSRFAAAHPEVAEVEVNPLLVRHEGAVGLDARIVLVGDT